MKTKKKVVLAGQKWRFWAMVSLITAILMVPWGHMAAAGYPEKDITIIVPWSPGGGTDVITRYIADMVEKDLGKPVVVVNKTGGGGLVGFQTVANAKPDGYTIATVSTSMILQKYAALTYVDRTRVEPIAMINVDPSAFTVKGDAPWKTLNEALDWAKKNPGKLRVSNSGPGAIWHICAATLEKKAGVKFTHVPYKGGNPAAVAVAGGHVEATTASPAEVSSFAQAGKLRILAISSEERDARFPDVPTYKESGVDLVIGTWRAIVAPKGTPEEVITKLSASIKKAVHSPKYKAFLEKGGFGWAYQGPEELGATMKRNDEDFSKVIPGLGLKKK